MSNEIIKKFIDNYNEFKKTGKLSLEQLVFSIENFRAISVDIEEVVKVINTKNFGDYAQYNIIDYLNAVYNDQVYELFLKERRDPKMCYWVINIEFYKVFNLYRILVIKANLLINSNSINEVIVKDFERTINNHVSDSITNIRKCIDFLRRNKHTEELLLCTRPFRKLLKMDEFGKIIFQRIFPNVNIEDLKDSDDEEEEEDDDEIDPVVKKKLETVLNNLNNLNKKHSANGENNELIEPIKNLVKEALKKAGIDIDLDSNTTITIEQNTQAQNQGQVQAQAQAQAQPQAQNPTELQARAQALQAQLQAQMEQMQSQMQAHMQNKPKVQARTVTTSRPGTTNTTSASRQGMVTTSRQGTVTTSRPGRQPSKKKLTLDEEVSKLLADNDDDKKKIIDPELEDIDKLIKEVTSARQSRPSKPLTKRKELEAEVKAKAEAEATAKATQVSQSVQVVQAIQPVQSVQAIQPVQVVQPVQPVQAVQAVQAVQPAKVKTTRKTTKKAVVLQEQQPTQSNIIVVQESSQPSMVETKTVETIKPVAKTTRKSIKKTN
jgi:hypothetical protein